MASARFIERLPRSRLALCRPGCVPPVPTRRDHVRSGKQEQTRPRQRRLPPASQLAVSSGCEPPAVTGSVRKLEAAGLVVRRPSPTDGRPQRRSGTG
ncbi:MAG: hypothetical protein DLM59_00680 [Pseudonocardiales bacterium]|nr:MAG: hypothetical protein DLM59_00680 [Pseudonocardiales bacterium]